VIREITRAIPLPIVIGMLLICSHSAVSQITSGQQTALNSYVDYANQSAKEIAIIVENLKGYYESVNEKRSWSGPRFSCPVQPDVYYFDNATKLGQSLNAPRLPLKLQQLKRLADSIDLKCKELDTYYKLEDYKEDNHAKGLQIVNKFPELLKKYREAQVALQTELEASFERLNKSANSYRKADQLMRKNVTYERSRLDLWNLNFEEKVHSGWPDKEISESILESDAHLKEFPQSAVTLKYPASSMWSSFQESVGAIMEEKRRAIDEYNFEAKKSDKHSNDVYLNLINYYNGTLVSNYNTFIDFAKRDGYFGLKFIQYFPGFEIRTQPKNVSVSVQPFADNAGLSLPVLNAGGDLSKSTFEALSNYIAFINETWRQVRYMQSTLTSFNSSASYYKSLTSFTGRGPLHFDFQDYNIPLSFYQKAVADSKVLPSSIANVLNGEAEVLLNILKEMDQHAARIEISVKARDYEKDNLREIYEHLERERALIKIWDERKEKFFNDVESVYQSHAFNTKSSWYVSGKALHHLVHLDHDALVKAKAFYEGDTTQTISTTEIDASLREVLANEYQNMNGIEKFGRNNGLCPYTPYEDLPATSRRLSELLKKIKNPSSGSRHPYEGMLYDYNEVIDQYNDFCTLSKDVLLLQHIFQPELFTVIYPREEPAKPNEPQKNKREEKVADKPGLAKQTDTKGRLLRDTVYIVQHDTIYKTTPAEESNFSMEGYASNNMVLLLDVSGSMSAPDKLPLLKQTLLSMLGIMREEDEISVIAFSKKAQVLLKPVSFKDEQKIRKAIETLQSAGKTDANAGLKAAYKVADDNYIRGGNNRIILATDGEFPISEATLKLVKDWAAQDIFLTIFNFGKNTSAKTLENLALLGHGNYEYISSENARFKLLKEAKSKKRK